MFIMGTYALRTVVDKNKQANTNIHLTAVVQYSLVVVISRIALFSPLLYLFSFVICLFCCVTSCKQVESRKPRDVQ